MTETQNSVRLGEIIKEFPLELLHEGEDYQNIPLRTLDVNRPGLPLSGFFEHFDTKRLLVMGLTETTYVSGMSEERRRESFDRRSPSRESAFRVACCSIALTSP